MKATFDFILKKYSREILITVVVAAIVITYCGVKTRKKKQAEIEQIRRAIADGVGASGEDIKTLLATVQPMPGYNALPLATQIKNAKSIFDDDEEAVYSAFRNKNKRQIKSIQLAFLQNFGLDLDVYLKGYGYSPFTVFLSPEEYQIVINIIKSANP